MWLLVANTIILEVVLLVVSHSVLVRTARSRRARGLFFGSVVLLFGAHVLAAIDTFGETKRVVGQTFKHLGAKGGGTLTFEWDESRVFHRTMCPRVVVTVEMTATWRWIPRPTVIAAATWAGDLWNTRWIVDPAVVSGLWPLLDAPDTAGTRTALWNALGACPDAWVTALVGAA
jgi:hypothetical protein